MKILFSLRFSARAAALLLCGGLTMAIASAQAAAQEAATPAANATAAAPETVSIFETGKLVVPAAIKRVKPANNIVEHEFEASLGEGDQAPTARVTLMPAMGGVKANIDRWIGQFSGPQRKVSETKQTTSGQWDVYVVKVSGQYAERMGGGPFAGGRLVRHDDYAMLGAILVAPQGEFPRRREYFVKMIGPEAVINAHEDAFKTMVNSVGQ